MTVGDFKFHLKRMLHGASESSIGDIELLMERAANTMLTKIDPLSTMRVNALPNAVHDDIFNYSLPSDFKKPIDLYPQDNRVSSDKAGRKFGEDFDLNKALEQRTASTESSEGTKFIRINWRSRQGKVLNNMNSVTDNGTWSGVGTATGIEADTIFKVSGSGSIKFDMLASGDGIQNITMDAVDLTDYDEVADIFVWVYLPSAPTSISAVWGNDLTTNYWTGVAQTTQADGAAFKVGWNLIKFSWGSATESGTVAPATTDSFKITLVTSGAVSNIRVDNIIFSIGRNFDLKYYSKYLIKNSSGTWITKSTSDNDIVVLDSDEIQLYLLECLIAASQQIEGADTAVDITWARGELQTLYMKYQEEHPSQTKKVRSTYYKL